MKLLGAFFRLIRWPNLLFIALTQFLFVYCIVHPIFHSAGILPNVRGVQFILLCVSSLLIAAGGYIINDYFDLDIDSVNKPERLVVDRIIRRRSTIMWHLFFSMTGVVIGFYLDITSGISFLGIANSMCVLLLFVYSISLKRKLLWGNILISLLTAWVVMVISWSEGSHLIHQRDIVGTGKIYRFTFLYAGFAFIISLIREAIKDMEDMEGDRKYDCRTMPIVWGLNGAKIFVSVWLIVLIAVITIVQFYVLQYGWWINAVYCVFAIILPLLWVFKKLFSAQSPAEFHRLSSIVKAIMLTGILSMLFFRLYY